MILTFKFFVTMTAQKLDIQDQEQIIIENKSSFIYKRGDVV